MRKLIYLLSVFTLCVSNSFAQGLEKIIVEKYYISEAKDTGKIGGFLPVGSVTYRIYLDLLPGYKFQAVFGLPEHELRISTTTYFFNNNDWGAMIPNVIPDRELGANTVMLDSWISAGGASGSNLGVLKSEDNGIGNIVNLDSILQGSNPLAGIPIRDQDGLISGIPSKITLFGIDSLVKIFDKHSFVANGTTFSTTNGSWATLGGAIGPDSTNKILIAQLTTNGALSFELNIQIGTPGGAVERYVAKNPVGEGIEFQIPSLTYPQGYNNIPPVVKIKMPKAKNTFKSNVVIPIQVDAKDTDGSIAAVELFVNDKKYSSNQISPFNFELENLEKNAEIYVVAVDNVGARSFSNRVEINISK
ncbi:hypothetical protein BH11BAC2_BH11BAC2_23850 [soil metagenome]